MKPTFEIWEERCTDCVYLRADKKCDDVEYEDDVRPCSEIKECSVGIINEQ